MGAADLDINIKGHSSGFGRVAAETTRQINGIKDAVKGIPVAAIGALGTSLAAFVSVDFAVGAAARIVDYAGRISDLSERVGITTDFLQAASYAATQFGATMEDVVTAVRELKRSSANAIANPGGSDAKAFQALGISIEKLKTLTAEDLFRAVAQAIEKSALSGNRLNEVLNLLGRSASSLIPMLRGGFTGLEADAKRLGIVIDKDVIEKLDSNADRWDKMKLQARARAAPVISAAFDAVGIGQKIGETILMVAGKVWDIKGTSHHPRKIFGAVADGWRDLKDKWNTVGNDGPINGPELPPGFVEPGAADQGTAGSRRRGGGGDMGSVAGGINADAMQRLGLFINGSSSMSAIASKQLTAAERSLEAQREMIRQFRDRL